MSNTQIQAVFSDTAEEEVRRLMDDIELAKTFEDIKTAKEISPELRTKMTNVLLTFAEVFSIKVPDVINNDIDLTLEMASRDINLSKLLRERGLFRIFRLINIKDENGSPIYMGMLNPNTGEPFLRMEDLIGYFCEASHVSRSLVFQRLATINKCISLGMSMDKAFATIITKPYAITETLNLIGMKVGDDLSEINPDIAKKLVNKYRDNSIVEESDDDTDEEKDDSDFIPSDTQVRFAITSLLDEVASHDRVKEVLDYVRHDVLKKPEISYKWDKESDSLVVELIRKTVTDDGREYVSQILSIPFYPDTKDALPDEIRADLLKRLPIQNRESVED